MSNLLNIVFTSEEGTRGGLVVLTGGPAGHGPGIVDYVSTIFLKVRQSDNNGQNEQKTHFAFDSVFYTVNRPRK
jgi:hypothetical protein